jgi:ATP-dependent Clp protease ATP-binding subunit ClpA
LPDGARELLAEKGWDQVYGARPLRRAIQKSVLDPLAMEVLQGRFREGQVVVVDRDGAELVFRNAAEMPEVVAAASS